MYIDFNNVGQVETNWFTLLCEKRGKGHPTTGRGGPRGSGYFKAPDFLDVRHYKGGMSSSLRTGRLYPRRNPWYSFSEDESTPGHMVPSGATEKSPVASPGINPRISRLVVQCFNHYATPGPCVKRRYFEFSDTPGRLNNEWRAVFP